MGFSFTHCSIILKIQVTFLSDKNCVETEIEILQDSDIQSDKVHSQILDLLSTSNIKV